MKAHDADVMMNQINLHTMILHNFFHTHPEKKGEWFKWTEIQIGLEARSKGENAPSPQICEKQHLYYLVGGNAKSFSIHYKRIQFRLWGVGRKILLSIIQFETSPLHHLTSIWAMCVVLKMKIVCSKKAHQFWTVTVRCSRALMLMSGNESLQLNTIENSCE